MLAREFVRNPHQPAPHWDRELNRGFGASFNCVTANLVLGLPAFDDEQIMHGLAQAWHGAGSFKEAAERPLLPVFLAMLTPEQQALRL